MDRRIINYRYSETPMKLLAGLTKFCLPQIFNYSAGAPVVLSDKITIVQRYEEHPMNSGVELAYRLSKDGQHILVFDPEAEDSLMYGLEDWTIDNLPDDKANVIIEMRDDPFWLLAYVLLMGREESKTNEEIQAIIEKETWN